MSNAMNSLIGQPIDRIDGGLKVTGQAKYAAEYTEGKIAHGYMLGAAIAKGRVVAIDTSRAERAPGVVYVMTHRNAPAQPEFGPARVDNRFGRARPVLNNNLIRYYDEPVALVVAETLESARHAAGLIDVRYERTPGRFDLETHLNDTYRPEKINAGMETDTTLGNFTGAFDSAQVQVDATYHNAYQNHNPMEPHAALAVWQGDNLTIYTSSQTVSNTQAAIAATLQIPPERVRIVSKFIGGGFGAKLGVQAETVLAGMAARILHRPVRVVQTRQQMYGNTGHRPAFVQRIRLGADKNGKLDALGHEVVSQTAYYEEFAEQTAAFTRSLYAAPNRITRHRLVRLDLPSGDTMRAPGEAPGMLALECAMDELAEKLGLDPIELRVRNEPTEDPERKVPFSSRGLIACMREGAQRFDWARRPSQPGTLRDGRILIGYGMSAAIRPNYLRPAQAKVRIDRHGIVQARLDMTDIGTGTYTILAQIAAEALGLPMDRIQVNLGDTDFPRTPGSGGSFGAASAGSALHNACLALREKIAGLAVADRRSPLSGGNARDAVFAEGMIKIGGRSEPFATVLSRGPSEGLEADGRIAPGETYVKFSQHGFGAHFAEVGVDMDTGEIRLRRMLGVFAAGRILNAKTARSQMIGGMIWGVGSALHEEGVVDPRYGHFVNHDLAEYHIPVNADIRNIEAIFLDEKDDKGNPLGIKGIGELGICGAGACVANAVYNATGIRVREFPITLDKLLPKMPLMAI
ncbi:xanthine dehydrogenase family protein molybdopterin-binding subunit [Ferrovibrio sp.]|uniref:xanthine dehydrogenase family protein molybdopterin-binding subunit n=1 Tax=Ferrovibrio sp. TaxID=1917215 RepID=UPI00311E17DA